MTISEGAAALRGKDSSADAFGIEVLAADDDGASVTMTVTDEMCNGLGIAHGGMLFLLADSAMAYASNQVDPAVATTAEIDWLAPASSGQILVATATRRWNGRRSALWDVDITDDGGTRLALFRGRTRQIGTPASPE